jgi:hypothetical protein
MTNPWGDGKIFFKAGACPVASHCMARLPKYIRLRASNRGLFTIAAQKSDLVSSGLALAIPSRLGSLVSLPELAKWDRFSDWIVRQQRPWPER